MTESSLNAIRSLANSDKGEKEFCESFLHELAGVVGANAGIVWDASNSSFRVVSQYSADEKPARLNLSKTEHDRLLGDAVNRDTPILIRAGEGDSLGNDAPMLFVGSFNRGGRHLIELMVSGDGVTEPDVKRKMQQFGKAIHTVSNGTAAAQKTIQPELPATDTPSKSGHGFSQDDLSSYLSAIHRSIDLKLTSANIANETRRLLDCDRVSVLVRQHGKYRVFAVSGQPSVNRRSNTTRLLEQVSRQVLKTGEGFWYPDEAEIPTQISKLLDEYLALSATRSLVVLPVNEKVDALVEDPDSLERKTNRVIGGIVFEHCHERWDRQDVEPMISLANDHSSNALRNAARHQQLFLYPLWNLLGKSKLLTAPRILSKTLMALVGLVVVALFLTFWQSDFYVTADGVMMPKNYKPVFSKIDAKVDRLFVEHGSRVEEGSTVAILSSREHELRVEELSSQLQNAELRLESMEERRFSDEADDGENVEETIVSLRAQVKNYQRQMVILDEISKSLVVKSPIDGQVITWDLKREREGRVISKGQELMEVAETQGEWELEIDIPVRRFGHIKRAIDASPDGLEVSFLLAADTTKRFTGRLISIEENASMNAQNEQVVRARASIEGSGISIEQTRTGVTTKIFCGKTSVGYLWFHDVGEFFQKHVLFKFR